MFLLAPPEEEGRNAARNETDCPPSAPPADRLFELFAILPKRFAEVRQFASMQVTLKMALAT